MRKIQATFFTILLMGFISCDNGQTFGVVTNGAEGEPCYEDGSCDKGMICKSDICVKEEDISNSGKDDGENSYIDENNSDSDTSDDLKYCGDNIINDDEICDGGTKNCTSISSEYTGGTANCRNDCSGWDVSTCEGTAAPFCGDNIINNNEICDGGTKACVSISQDYSSGTAICKSDCSGWNVSNCKYCGNGSVDSGEICDGGTKSCTSISSDYVSGTANCRNDCSGWDVSKCDGTVAPFCGDNIVNNGEICDGGSKNCTLISSEYKSGVAICKADCSDWNSDNCSSNCPVSNMFCHSFSGNNWSDASSDYMDWYEAKTYCEDIIGGRLPTISELRTLIQNCLATETGGECKATDDCLSWDDCWANSCYGCEYNDSGKYSVFGDTYWFWSSSPRVDGSTDYIWSVSFRSGGVSYSKKDTSNGNVRCVN
ncbi:MAG TPA: DUF1566 domain-containing protein [bacterium]|nr:DUF1566 domain-containing protein [bacterium]